MKGRVDLSVMAGNRTHAARIQCHYPLHYDTSDLVVSVNSFSLFDGVINIDHEKPMLKSLSISSLGKLSLVYQTRNVTLLHVVSFMSVMRHCWNGLLNHFI